MAHNTGPADDLGPMNAGWETFLGPRAAMRREPGERLLEHLDRLGVDPGDVTHVVLTPLQLYTVANVLRFPRAQVCISERGWDHFHHGRPVLHDARDTSLPPEILEPLMTTERDRVRLLGPEDEVVPGVRTWWSGAHHRASLVVEVDTALGVAALSDSFFHVANVTEDHPIGICESTWEAFDTYDRVRRTADVVIPLYDPGNLERFPDGVVA